MNNEEPEDEVLDFNKPDFTFIPGERHDWRQHGPYIICRSCQLEHASYVGMERLLVGIDDDGKPIFKRR